jgi:predicted RNA-binding protein with EMAP domain
MTHDTSKDPRLLVAQRACHLLKKTIHQKLGVRLPVGREKLDAWASSAESAVMTLTYTYQEPTDLAASEQMKEIEEAARSLENGLEPVIAGKDAPPLHGATLRWCLRILSGLPARFGNRGTTLASGVDLVAVEVKNVARTGKLWLTRVGDGNTEYPVVTNMPTIAAGNVYAVAFLPPAEVGGTVSEAMFLGDEKRSEEAGAVLSEDEIDAREASSVLHGEIARH